MIELVFEEVIRKNLPEMAVGCLEAHVVVGDRPSELDRMIHEAASRINETMLLEAIQLQDPILGTRAAYRKLGKDPSRYRPSAEALMRRIVQGKGLYSVNNVVDALNLISFTTGYSIGGWDLDQIQGKVRMGVGLAGEPYETIGRGPMNIEGFPVMRDDLGAFGTPTSDSLRTSVTPQTKRFLFAIYAFDGGGDCVKMLDRAADLYRRFADATFLETKIFTVY